jgi:nucleoid DNA-binding protein
VVDSFFGAIARALKEGDRVNLAGFGTFIVVDKPPRPYGNYLFDRIITSNLEH